MGLLIGSRMSDTYMVCIVWDGERRSKEGFLVRSVNMMRECGG